MRKRIRQSSASPGTPRAGCAAPPGAHLTAQLAASNTASTESPAMSTTRPSMALDRLAEDRARLVERGDRAAARPTASGASSRQRRRRGSSPGVAAVGGSFNNPSARTLRCAIIARPSTMVGLCPDFLPRSTPPARARAEARASRLDYNDGSRRHVSSQRRRSRFRLLSPVCLRLAPVTEGSRPMIWQTPLMTFDSLGLAEPLLRAVHEAGYDTPTPIQSQAIPAVLVRRRRAWAAPRPAPARPPASCCRCCTA